MSSNRSRRLVIETTMDSKGVVTGAKKVETATEKMGRTVSKSGKDIAASYKKVAIGAAAAFGGREVVQWVSDSVQLAVAAEEVESKFQAVFGASDEMRQSLVAWGDMAGVTTTEAMNLAATFGNLAIAQGINSDTAKEMALDVAGLAGDMASFNDSDPSIVFDDLNKALLTTEREGMKKYGIAITTAEVKTRAAALAAQDGRTEITKADSAYASYAIAVEQAGSALGDLERTQGSVANQQRQVAATVKELQEEIGRELLPVYRDLLEVTTDLIPMSAVLVSQVADLTNIYMAFRSAIEIGNDSTKSTAEQFEGLSKGVVEGALGITEKLLPAVWLANRGLSALGIEVEVTAAAIDDAVPAADELRGELDELDFQSRRTADGVDDLTDATATLADETRKLVDPVFRAKKAEEDFLKTLAAVKEDGIATAEEIDTLAQKKLALAAATAAVTPEAMEAYRDVIKDVRENVVEDAALMEAAIGLVGAEDNVTELKGFLERLEAVSGKTLTIDLTGLKMASQADFDHMVTRALLGLQRRGVIRNIYL